MLLGLYGHLALCITIFSADSLIVQGAKGQGNNVMDGTSVLFRGTFSITGIFDWDIFSESVILFGLY